MVFSSFSKCSYSGCERAKKTHPELTFHTFPVKHPDTAVEWSRRSGNKDLEKLTLTRLKYRLMCSAHFDENDFLIGRRRLLKDRALPKIHDSVSNSGNNSDKKNYDSCNNDHDYVKIETTVINEQNVGKTVHLLQKTLAKARVIIQRQRKMIRKLKYQASRVGKSRETSKVNYTKYNFISAATELFNDEKKLTFINMQATHITRKRWSDEEKQLALLIYQRGPRCYRFLKNELKLALPCLSLIQSWLNKINLKTGFDPAFCSLIRNKIEFMNRNEADCVKINGEDCEDHENFLFDTNQSLQTDTEHSNRSINIDRDEAPSHDDSREYTECANQTGGHETLEMCSARYLAGYLAFKSFQNQKCDKKCHKKLLKDIPHLQNTSEVLLDCQAENNRLGNFHAPTEEFFEIISDGVEIFKEKIKSTLHMKSPKQRFVDLFKKFIVKNQYKWTTEICIDCQEYILRLFARTLIHCNLKCLSVNVYNGSANKRSASDSVRFKAKLKKYRSE